MHRRDILGLAALPQVLAVASGSAEPQVDRRQSGSFAAFGSLLEARAETDITSLTAFSVEGFSTPADGGACVWTKGTDPVTLRLGVQLGEAFFLPRGRVINPNMLGAVQDGVTDDSVLIERADMIAVALGVPLELRSGPHPYGAHRTVRLSGATDVIFEQSSIVAHGVHDTAALVIGDHHTPMMSRRFLNIDVRAAKQSDWTDEGFVGVRVLCANQCEITVRRARGFYTGVELCGSGGGFAYNEVSLFEIVNNRIGLDCRAQEGGWCNENMIHGGRFYVESGVNAGRPRTGVVLRSVTAPHSYLNGIVLDKPSFELNGGEGEAVAIDIQHGMMCHIRDARDEGNTTFLRSTNDSQAIFGNILGAGSVHHKPTIDDRSTQRDAALLSSSELAGQFVASRQR